MKKISVSIGIPAFNEESNIKYLLQKIIDQSLNGCVIDKIYINLDGSTDKTEYAIKLVKDGRIKILRHKKRLGKSVRLNEFFKINKSDVLIIFDADIFLENNNVISSLISPFKDPVITLVSANNLPTKPTTFIGKVWYAAEIMWYEMRKNVDGSKTIYNNSGCSIAIRKAIAEKIKLPEGTVADQQFVYINNLESGGKFYFQKKALVYYNAPSTLKDILIQYKRSSGEMSFFQFHFGHKYDVYFNLPFINKFTGLIISMIKDPIFTVLSVLLLKILKFATVEENEDLKLGIWSITKSTKRLISL